ncbi:MAG: hypothetical protein AAB215_03910 [Planctomycetota bacterium]
MEIGRFEDCRVASSGARIVVENARIRRVWRLHRGRLQAASVEDRASGADHARVADDAGHAFEYRGLFPANTDPLLWHPLRLSSVRARVVKPATLEAAHLEASVLLEDSLQGLSIRMIHRVFPGTPAIRSSIEIRAENYPRGPFLADDPMRAVEALALAQGLRAFEVVDLIAKTDRHHDGLRVLREGRVPTDPAGFDGCIAILKGPDGRGMFVLKEGPPAEERRAEVPCDFRIGAGFLRVLGWGIAPHEFCPDRDRASYGWSVGVFEGGREGAVRAIRETLDARFPRNPSRDDQFMANPWGANKRGEGMTEAFLKREIRACASLGIPAYQPDAGWETGHPRSHAHRVLGNLVLPDDAWTFRKSNFPRGFEPVAREARDLGVRLGLWFSPDLHRQYRTWREEADILLDLWRRHGIDAFKIDTVLLRSKDADENLDAFCRRVLEESRGRATLNLDITAGQRWGYFRALDCGNLFLENRYTQWGNYWPWKTLRHLWQLAEFVPTRKLQIEILDTETGAGKYDRKDPTRPAAAGQDYAAAVALFANPLFWGEPSSLSAKGRASIARMTALWKSVKDEVLSGTVWPVGEEPSGRGFPGFQSAGSDGRGIAIFYREAARAAKASFDLRVLDPGRYRIEPVWPPGPPRFVRFGRQPRLEIEFARPHDFRIVRYARLP